MPPRKSPQRKPVPVTRALREVADHVSAWRRLRGLTQQQLADRAGVSRNTVRALEAGTGSTSLENVLRILRAVGLLDAVPEALDPMRTDIGRARVDLPQRVRTRDLSGGTDG
jgi:transcriptional regulator with XRE-family HTH domain